MRVKFDFVPSVSTPEKIHGIKAIRTVTGLGLKEAKEVIEANTISFIASMNSMTECRTFIAEMKVFGYDITNAKYIENLFGDIETEFKEFIKRCVNLEKMELVADLSRVYSNHYCAKVLRQKDMMKGSPQGRRQNNGEN